MSATTKERDLLVKLARLVAEGRGTLGSELHSAADAVEWEDALRHELAIPLKNRAALPEHEKIGRVCLVFSEDDYGHDRFSRIEVYSSREKAEQAASLQRGDGQDRRHWLEVDVL